MQYKGLQNIFYNSIKIRKTEGKELFRFKSKQTSVYSLNKDYIALMNTKNLRKKMKTEY